MTQKFIDVLSDRKAIYYSSLFNFNPKVIIWSLKISFETKFVFWKVSDENEPNMSVTVLAIKHTPNYD